MRWGAWAVVAMLTTLGSTSCALTDQDTGFMSERIREAVMKEYDLAEASVGCAKETPTRYECFVEADDLFPVGTVLPVRVDPENDMFYYNVGDLVRSE